MISGKFRKKSHIILLIISLSIEENDRRIRMDLAF